MTGLLPRWTLAAGRPAVAFGLSVLLIVGMDGPARAEAQSIPVPHVPAPADGTSSVLHFVQGADLAPLPYQAARGIILFRATVNGLPATVMLDNGTGRTLIDTGFARRAGIGLHAAGSRAVTGAASRLATSGTDPVTLAAEHAFVLKGPVAAIDLGPVSAALGTPVDAVLGMDVLDHAAVMIQPAKRQLSLAASGSIGGGVGVDLPIVDGNGIAAEVNGRTVKLKLDLGSAGAIRLTDVAWHRVLPSGAPTESSDMTSADGVTRSTLRGRAPVRFGRLSAQNVAIDSGYVATGGMDGLIGTRFLTSMTVLIDWGKARLSFYPAPSQQIAR